MAKMFYKTDEAAQKLGISGDQLKQLVAENKLREFRDGAQVMFKVDQVDKLASDRKGGTSSGTSAGTSAGSRAGTGGPIGLADSTLGGTKLGDSHASDVISLADTSTGSLAKDDTVVTGEVPGQKVFKPGEVKTPADTGAQTQIQSAIEDQLSLEGVGSGSGLLDLTRESDDTSLGAELLDEIYPGGDSKGESGIGSASGIFVEQASPGGSSMGGESAGSASGLENLAASSTSSPAIVTEVVESNDPTSGAFGGMALASVLISVVTGLITLAFFQGFTPNWVGMITSSTTNVLIFGVVLFVVSVLFAFFGFFVSRATR